MAQWAVSNLTKWPTHEVFSEADPEEIGCRFSHYAHLSSLPVLECKFGGVTIDSTVYFYAKRSRRAITEK